MLDKPLLNQLFRYAISLTHQEDQAYDVLQSCVEKFLKADHSSIQSVEAYLMRMIRNEFIDQTRKKCFYSDVGPEVVSKISDESALGTLSMEDVFIQQSEVESLLGTMSGDERELLFLWAVEEYTLEEISQMKQVPRGTLLSKLHRLKKRVQLQQNSDNVLNMRVKS
jgi:RNA polymerase sigma-70 factor (ECF subfamily)